MEEQKMTIVEALKELRLIEKKMVANNVSITKYASMVSTEKPYFESEDAQKKEVKALVQSNADLLKRYLDLKTRIEKTNFSTIVKVLKEDYTITQLLTIKRRMAKAAIDTLNALNDSAGNARMQAQRYANSPEGNPPQVVRIYNEREKIEGLAKWSNLYNEIDSRLEFINATTPLMD